MKFAQRTASLKPEGAYKVLERARDLEAQGKDIIHLEIGQPGFNTFSHISQAGIQAIRDGHTRYNPPSGIQELRRAIAEDAGFRRGMRILPEQVVIGPGAKPGLFFPTLAVVDPGDEVLYPDPGFPTYPAMIQAAGGVPVPIPLDEKNGFSFDIDAFNARVSGKTKMIILNSPANPTGGVMPLKDLKSVAETAERCDCWVMSDEIYSRLIFDRNTPISIAALKGMEKRTIIVDGFSKTYAMTGWRLGYMIAPEPLARRLDLLMTHAVGCTASFTQVAGIEAINGNQVQVEEALKEYRMKRDLMVQGLNTIPGISCQSPGGAFYAFPNIRKTGFTSTDLAMKLLDRAGVACLSGTDFGENGEGYLRMCYACSSQDITMAIERISDWVKRQN
ncbi:pyridoxal phosphate-dependent aminotransferase [Desulfospira joergensenii]|uniref:pyridoxal phosphate-dependent aminotransferase n=1 Tax=Desulfospira joergensenii TaxID=53329 RepID=UPI0003B700BC|nr:pyridoxal phosphate-dependent aminotransferase [Desulfospira joergensenii]